MRLHVCARRCAQEKDTKPADDPDSVARKFGLEAGLFKAWTSPDAQNKGVTAQDLLKRYGGAYLITSITLSLISFSLCYLAVDAGAGASCPCKLAICTHWQPPDGLRAGTRVTLNSRVVLVRAMLQCFRYF